MQNLKKGRKQLAWTGRQCLALRGRPEEMERVLWDLPLEATAIRLGPWPWVIVRPIEDLPEEEKFDLLGCALGRRIEMEEVK